MLQLPFRATRSTHSSDPTPPTAQPAARRAARAEQRTAASVARAAVAARARARVDAGSPPIDVASLAMREAAARSARALQARDLRRAPVAPQPTRSARDARRLARTITAGASLLLSGAMVLGTSLPAAAVPTPSDFDPAVAQLEAGTQALDAIAAEPTSVLDRDDVIVRAPAPPAPEAPEAAVPVAPREAGGMSPGRLAELQAVASSEPAGSSFGGDPAFPRVWSMLETDYVQTPFPDLAQVPISSGFGYRSGGFHGGTDVPLPTGQAIRPIADGVVSEVFHGDNPGGGGYAVFIDHNIDGQFVQSWYAHMVPGSIRVEVGQVVDVTTVIGDLGNSGRSTGPHLHLELKNSDYVSFDPVLWLQTRQMDLESSY